MVNKPKENEESRKVGPKFRERKSVIPEGFQIRRSPSPMGDILREAERDQAPGDEQEADRPKQDSPAATSSTSTTEESGSTEAIGTTSTTNLPDTTSIPGSTILPGTTKGTGLAKKTGSTKLSGTTKSTDSTSQTQRGVAPERDFQRVPNSVTREAMAARLFRGKSKQVWDYLWSVSRGAIIPRRTVRCSRPKLKAGAGLGSMGTVDAAIEHLQAVGLVVVETIVGENGGNVYEVFTPEEVTARLFGVASTTGTTNSTGSTGTTQNLVVPVLPESGSTSSTLSSMGSVTSGQPNTFFKTIEENDDDDAALAGLTASLKTAAREITGREVSSAESDRWRELADVLVAELKIAAARTTVSSVPSFLAEHLRRRLWKLDKKQARAEGKELPDEISIPVASKDTKNCSDCGGTGFYYPTGYEGGVAKCKHERLRAAEDDPQK